VTPTQPQDEEEENKMNAKPEYDSDCAACLRHQPHTVEEHNECIARATGTWSDDVDENDADREMGIDNYDGNVGNR
jgi:hypothetical protein